MGGGGRFAPSAEGVGGCEYRGNDSPEAASGQRGLSRDARSETLATAERGERDAGKRGETRGCAGRRRGTKATRLPCALPDPRQAPTFSLCLDFVCTRGRLSRTPFQRSALCHRPSCPETPEALGHTVGTRGENARCVEPPKPVPQLLRVPWAGAPRGAGDP